MRAFLHYKIILLLTSLSSPLHESILAIWDNLAPDFTFSSFTFLLQISLPFSFHSRTMGLSGSQLYHLLHYTNTNAFSHYGISLLPTSLPSPLLKCILALWDHLAIALDFSFFYYRNLFVQKGVFSFTQMRSLTVRSSCFYFASYIPPDIHILTS